MAWSQDLPDHLGPAGQLPPIAETDDQRAANAAKASDLLEDFVNGYAQRMEEVFGFDAYKEYTFRLGCGPVCHLDVRSPRNGGTTHEPRGQSYRVLSALVNPYKGTVGTVLFRWHHKQLWRQLDGER